jgi:hypothetical protein
MNLSKMIAELQAERDRLDEAILALERLSVSNSKRRGRPPRWLQEQGETVATSPAPLDGAGDAAN